VAHRRKTLETPAIVCDGASVMLGRKSGVVTRHGMKYPKLFSWHCLNHRLELALCDAIRDVTAVNHFKAFLDFIYSLCSQSTKNQLELRGASRELETQILRELETQILQIGQVLDVRWISSSFRTVKAAWT